MLYALPGVVFGLTVHEYCHAMAAYKLGDTTARDMGRLTFNPFRHIDLIGFLFLLLAGFGWAKPVQFNPENLRHPRRDKAIIAAAGPLSNLVLALALIGIIKIWLVFLTSVAATDKADQIYSVFYSAPFIGFVTVIFQGAAVNLGLFIFNLIPIPPLDGSHIVFSGLNLSAETERTIMKIGGPLLFIILIVQNRMNITIFPIAKLISAIFKLFIPQIGQA